MLSELFDNVENLVGGVHEWFKFRDLAADVHIDARNLNAGKRGGMSVKRHGLIVSNAELIVLEPCGNVRMGLGVDIRIDAHGNRRQQLFLQRHFVDAVEFRNAFDVKAADACARGGTDIFSTLADA